MRTQPGSVSERHQILFKCVAERQLHLFKDDSPISSIKIDLADNERRDLLVLRKSPPSAGERRHVTALVIMQNHSLKAGHGCCEVGKHVAAVMCVAEAQVLQVLHYNRKHWYWPLSTTSVSQLNSNVARSGAAKRMQSRSNRRIFLPVQGQHWNGYATGVHG